VHDQDIVGKDDRQLSCVSAQYRIPVLSIHSKNLRLRLGGLAQEPTRYENK